MNESIILEKENLKISKEESIFKIEFKSSEYSLINSLIKTRIIKGGSTDEKYKIITFNANTVKTLEDFRNEKNISQGRKKLTIPDVSKMIHTLSIQLNYLLECENRTIIGYNEEDIIVINDKNFAFLSSELVADIDSEGTEMAIISCPFSSNGISFSGRIIPIVPFCP